MDRLLLPIYKALFNKQLVEDIYNRFLPTDFFWILIAVTLSGCFFFYKNPLSFRTWFYKTSHWFTTGIITAFICLVWSIIICLLQAQKMLPRDENDPTLGEYFDSGFSTFFAFGLGIGAISFILFSLFSIGLRYFSLNARKTPF
jgi:hypothetical protein